MRSSHSQRLERFLGTERIERMSSLMKGWYGPPIFIADVPGSVQICGDGDFIGPFEHGYAASAFDVIVDGLKRLTRGRVSHGTFHAGFTSVSNYLARVAQGYSQNIPIYKILANAANAHSYTCWLNSNFAGAIGSAAPGGRACDVTTTGAQNSRMTNAASGETLHLTAAEMTCRNDQSILIYDRLFDVAKTMNSTSTEAVTGVPTRYQSTTVTDENSAVGNFLCIETITTIASTAHNWTECQYTDQAGNTGAILPSVTGVSGSVVGRLDQTPAIGWFLALADGDTGVKALTQMQCSANVATGTIDFVIGHPLAWLAFVGLSTSAVTTFTPNVIFDFITTRKQAPRVFDDACISFLGINAIVAGTSTPPMSGYLELTSAAA